MKLFNHSISLAHFLCILLFFTIRGLVFAQESPPMVLELESMNSYQEIAQVKQSLRAKKAGVEVLDKTISRELASLKISGIEENEVKDVLSSGVGGGKIEWVGVMVSDGVKTLKAKFLSSEKSEN